jgi:hypothetical protein
MFRADVFECPGGVTMFRVFCGDEMISRSPDRREALNAARSLSRGKEILVEGPHVRFVYAEGSLDRFWLELRRT